MRRGLTAERRAKIKMGVVVLFVVRFGSAGFGLVWWGLAGLKTQGGLVAKKRRPPGCPVVTQKADFVV